MKQQHVLMLALSLHTLGWPAYAAWVPVDCKNRIEDVRQLHRELGRPDVEATWQNYVAAVRKSVPGSPVYAPHPFPKTEAEIVANFKYAYFDRLFEGTPWEGLPSREQPVYRALKENRLRIEIVQVEKWGLSRCASERPIPYLYLLRFFDQSGSEVARSTQHFTGLMGVYQSFSRQAPYLPSLGDLDSFLRSKFGREMHAEQAQYVSVDGLPDCSDHRPCVAFKSGAMLYLIDGGQLLYEIEPTAPRKSVAAFRAEQAAAGLARLGAIEYDAPMVTLGFEWARARLVGGQKPK